MYLYEISILINTYMKLFMTGLYICMGGLTSAWGHSLTFVKSESPGAAVTEWNNYNHTN